MSFLRRPGGARIYGVFDNQLPAALRKLPFDRHLSLQNVRKVVSEADGYQPHLIAPEQGYRRLIDGTLNYFRGPAEASVDAVRVIMEYPSLLLLIWSFHVLVIVHFLLVILVLLHSTKVMWCQKLVSKMIKGTSENTVLKK